MKNPLSLLFLLAGIIAGTGCQPPAIRPQKSYAQEQAHAEVRAQAFKESGQWTPAAIRRLAGSLKSGAVVPEVALAEIGIVVLEDSNLTTVKDALEQQARAREGR